MTIGAFRDFVTATGYVTEPEKDGKGGWGYDPKAAGKLFVGPEPRFTWRHTGWEQTELHPVVNVTWNDSIAFVDHLNQHAKRSSPKGQLWRLAREAEWEYACRAGTGAFYYNDNDPEEFYRIGNCVDGTWNEKWPNKSAISGKSGFLFSAAVSQFQPNAFGLHDMLGNVWEWCSDWYGAYDAHTSPIEDPAGPASGSSRVLRGGSWLDYALYCRSAYRGNGVPSNRLYNIGFRLLCELF